MYVMGTQRSWEKIMLRGSGKLSWDNIWAVSETKVTQNSNQEDKMRIVKIRFAHCSTSSLKDYLTLQEYSPVFDFAIHYFIRADFEKVLVDKDLRPIER